MSQALAVNTGLWKGRQCKGETARCRQLYRSFWVITVGVRGWERKGVCGDRMGAVGRLGILICTKMQLICSWKEAEEQGAGGGGGCLPASLPDGHRGGAKGGEREEEEKGKVPASRRAEPAGAVGRRALTCQLGLPGAAKLGERSRA